MKYQLIDVEASKKRLEILKFFFLAWKQTIVSNEVLEGFCSRTLGNVSRKGFEFGNMSPEGFSWEKKSLFLINDQIFNWHCFSLSYILAFSLISLFSFSNHYLWFFIFIFVEIKSCWMNECSVQWRNVFLSITVGEKSSNC